MKTSYASLVIACLALLGIETATAASGTWTTDTSDVWSATGNWLGGIVADGTDAVADFSTVDITAPRTVTVDASHNLGALLFGGGADVRTNTWTLTATGNSALTLAVSSGSPTITVSNGVSTNTATFNVPLAGTQGLTKAGAGTLVLGGTNSYSGATTVSAGRLQLTNATSAGPVLYLSFNNVNGNIVTNGGSGGAAMNGLIVGTGISVSAGGPNGNNALNIGGGSVNAGYVLVNSPGVNFSTNLNWTMGIWMKTSTTGAVYAYQGDGAWASGNTTFHLNGGTNDLAGAFAGGVRFAQGWETGTTNLTDGNWHFVVMTCTGGAKTNYVDGLVDAWATNQWNGAGNGGQLWIGGTPNATDGDVRLNGQLAEVYVYNRALSVSEVQALQTAAGPAAQPVIPAISSVSVAAPARFDLNGVSPTVAGLTGVGVVDNTLATGTNQLVINNSTDILFGGAISNTIGILSLHKTGAGALTLTNASLYTGNTILDSGTLNINNASAIGTAGTFFINGGTIDNTNGSTVTVINNKAQTWAGDFTFTGTTNLSFGTGTATLNGPATNRVINVVANTLTVGRILGNVGTGFGLTKTGAGTLALGSGGASTINGDLNVLAGKVQIGINDFNSVAGLSGNGIIENGSATTRWLFVNAATNKFFPGTLQDGTGGARLGFNKLGVGTVTLSGTNSYSDTTTIQNGTLKVTGTNTFAVANVGLYNIGSVGNQNGVLEIAGGTVNANKSGSPSAQVAAAANARGFVRMTNSGAFTTASEFHIGQGSGAATTQPYAVMTMGGTSTMTNGSYLVVGFNNDRAVLNQLGGAIAVNANVMTIGAGGTGSIGVANLSGGTFSATAASGGIFIGERGVGVLNVSGTASVSAANVGLNLGPTGSQTGWDGTANLLGGTVTANKVAKGVGTGAAKINFNGGTLKASGANVSFMTGLDSAYVYANGATIDDGGFAITVGQLLLAPAGQGVLTIPVTSGGSNYIDTPLVLVTNIDGSGATAVAQIDYAAGTVTSIQITCAGNNYSTPPNVGLFGGGGSGATLGTPTLGATTSGGLTKKGSGSLTLGTGNTYTGATKVLGGTLNLAPSTLSASGDLVISNATLALDASSGSPFSPVNVSLQSNAVVSISYGALSGNPAFNAVNASGTLTSSGTNTINVNGTGFATGQFPLIKYTGTALASISNFKLGTLPPGVNATLVNNTGNDSIDLNITFIGQTLTWYGTAGGNWDINTTANWQTGGNAAKYLEYGSSPNIFGDLVTFDDTLTNDLVNPRPTNIVLTTTLRPSLITLNSSLPYSFTGVGSLAGTASLTLNGSGPATLGTSNSYSGGTVINNGTLTLGDPSAIGTGALTIAGGALDSSVASLVNAKNNAQNWNGDFTFVGSQNLNLGTGAVTMNASRQLTVSAGTLTIGGGISGNGLGLTKTGNGTLALAGTNTYTGTTIINAGTLAATGGVTGTTNANIQISPSSADTGIVTVSGGNVYADRVIIAGNSPNTGTPGNGTLNQSGGTIISREWFTVGSGATSGGSGTFNMSGGTLIVQNQQMEVGNFIGSDGTVNMSGSASLSVWNGNFISMGANNNATAGTFNQNGGTVTLYSDAGVTPGGNGILYIGRAGTLSGTFTYSLNGGTLTVPQIQRNAANTATAVFNFNGGTLKASKANTGFMQNLSSINVQAGGAIIDSGTFAVTIPQPLIDNGGGGLTKLGTGTLTLSGADTYTGSTTVSSGELFVTPAHQVSGAVTVADGAAFGVSTSSTTNGAAIGALTLGASGATILDFSYGISGNPTNAALVAGAVTVNGSSTLRLGGAFTAGAFPLLQYSSLSGSFSLALPRGVAATLSNDVVHSTLYAVVSSVGGALVWKGTNSISPNVWDIGNTTNWLFAGQPANYQQPSVPGDSVLFNDSGSGTVTLATNASPASMVISNNSVNYTFQGSGSIAGTTSLLKLGTGTATLSWSGDTYTGNTTISNGVLQLGSATAIPSGTGSGNVVIGPSGSVDLNGFAQTINGLSGSGIIDNSSATASVLTLGNGNGAVTWSGTITNTGTGGESIIKVGTGNTTITGTNYLRSAAASQINGGTLTITNGGALYMAGSAEFWVQQNAGSATVIVDGGTLVTSNNWMVIGRNNAAATGTLIVNSGLVQKAGNNNLVVGSLGATGYLYVNGGQVLNNGNLWLGENTGANAYLYLNGGLIQATQVRPNGTTPANYIAYFNGGTLQATASSTNYLSVFSMVMSNGLVLDDNGFTLTIDNSTLQDGDGHGGGFIKKGSGKVYIDTSSSFTGTTLVTNGTLAGIGSFTGPMVVAPAGNLGAGDSNAVGTLTINNDLTLQGNASLRVNKTGGTPSQDQVVVSGNINYSGTLSVSNITSDATPLTTSDTFQLFNVTGTHTGNFTSIAGSPGTGLAYSFNPATGILSVVAGIASYPTNITASVSGSTLSLTWPSTHLGWILQAQTNNLNAGLNPATNSWFDVTGSSSTTNMNVTINPLKPTVFFRLRHP